MNGGRLYYAKRNKSVREIPIPYDFTLMWNLRKKTEQHRRRGKKEREANHKRFLIIENKLRVDRGRWVGEWVDG